MVGSQNIGFTFTGDGSLDLLRPASFYGGISGFTSDAVELLGSWILTEAVRLAGWLVR
jgi:hypothetical protein